MELSNSKIGIVFCPQGLSLFICRKPTTNFYDQIGYPASAGPLSGK